MPITPITALAGGVGASKLLEGLSRAISPEDISIVVNTGDDIELFGLYIAPDIDIVTYTLAGLVNPATGWGILDDSFNCLDLLLRYSGDERWFNLGDRDLATHIFRTQKMREGQKLSQIAETVRTAMGVKSRIIPMTDTHTPTTIITDEGIFIFRNIWLNDARSRQSRASASSISKLRDRLRASPKPFCKLRR